MINLFLHLTNYFVIFIFFNFNSLLLDLYKIFTRMSEKISQNPQISSAPQPSTSSDPANQFRDKEAQIESLISAFPDGKVPETALGKTLNDMMDQWNSLLSQVVTEVDHNQPIPDHIKETAEFSVKQFRDACLNMNSQLTRISMNWQLSNRVEMVKQEIADYESSIQRQKNLLEKIKQKIDEDLLTSTTMSS